MIDSEESHYKSNKSHKNLLKNVGPKKKLRCARGYE